MSPADFQRVYNDQATYPLLDDVGVALGMKARTVREWATRLRDEVQLVKRRSGPRPAAREIITQPSSPDEPIEDLLQRIFTHNERYDRYHAEKDCIDIKLRFDGPYGVVGLPDHHLNNVGTEVRRAFADAQTIAAHPRLFAIGIGDWIDNFIVGRLERERRKDVMSHGDSWRVMEHYVGILAPKLIAAISGNHNDWAASAGGVDVTKKMFERFGLGPIYDTDQVRVRLRSPRGQSSTHLVRHKYRGNSRFNSVHAITVKILEDWQGEDVVWGGHIHTAGHVSIQKFWHGASRTVHGVQLGSYKKHDSYAKREAFRQNVPFVAPMTVHIPATGQIVFFDDMYVGIQFLDAISG